MIFIFAERLKKARKNAGLTQEKLAKYIGVERSSVGKYESTSTIPSSDVLAKISQVLKVSTDWLLTGSETISNNINFPSNVVPFSEVVKKRVRVIGEIACGEPIFAQEQYGDFVDCGVDADYALTCKGDSMIDARINDGDLVFIKKQDIVDNGAIAAVIIDNEATLKRVFYYPETQKLILQAANPKYEPFVYIGAELENVRILGRAVAFQSLL